MVPTDATTLQLKAALAAYKERYPGGYASEAGAAVATALERPPSADDGGGLDSDGAGGADAEEGDDFSDWDEDEDDGVMSSAASNRRCSFSVSEDLMSMHREIDLLMTMMQ